MNKYFYIGIAYFFIFNNNSLAQAQNIKNTDPIQKQIMNWDSVSGTIVNKAYKKSAACGSISMELPKWVKFQHGALEIVKNFPHDLLAYVKLGSKIHISMFCSTKINYEDSKVFFNKETQKWELKDQYKDSEIEDTDRKAYKIYQLKAKNASGWLRTATFQRDSDDHGNYDYMKNATFCLINDKQTKEICGSEDVQFIPDKKHLGTQNSDYTPMLIQFLETLQFEDDK